MLSKGFYFICKPRNYLKPQKYEILLTFEHFHPFDDQFSVPLVSSVSTLVYSGFSPSHLVKVPLTFSIPVTVAATVFISKSVPFFFSYREGGELHIKSYFS